MRHADFLQSFQDGLFTGTLPPGVTARAPDEAAQRFAVYRNNVAHSLSRALAARFPAVERILGAEFFAALAPLFLAERGPQNPMLFAWGGGFADFLAGFPPLVGLPWVADVARIEFARGEAYHAADAEPLPPEALSQAAADAGRARLALHPSLRIVPSRFAAVSAWAMNQPGATPAPLEVNRPETALILRDRRDDVPVRALGPGDAAFVAALQSGLVLIRAAEAAATVEPGHDPGAILLSLARAGALTGLAFGETA